jgi:hypothetical protein
MAAKMAEERFHRPEPERTAPNRSFAGVLRSDPWANRDDYWHRRNGSFTQQDDHSQSRKDSSSAHPSSFTNGSSSTSGTSPFPTGGASVASVAQQAVDLAYELSEPYVQAGRQAAELYSSRMGEFRSIYETPSSGGQSMNQPYIDPLAQAYGQIARSFAELMVSVTRTAYGPWSMGGPSMGAYQAYPRYRDGAATGSGCCPNCGRPNAQNQCCPRCGRPFGQCGCSPTQGANQCCPGCGRPRGQCCCSSAQGASQCCPRCGRPFGQCWCSPFYGTNPPKELKLEVTCPPDRSARIFKHLDRQSSSPRIPLLANVKSGANLALEPDVKIFNGYNVVYVTVTDDDAGIYAGPVFDGETGGAIGYVSVEVIELKNPKDVKAGNPSHKRTR